MSLDLAATRQAIAAALSTVTGVTGFAYRPTAPKAGDAWPLLGSIERDDDTPAFYVNWRVRVLLPADEVSATAWIDGHLQGLADSLSSVGWIESFEATRDDIQFALDINMRS